MIFGIIYAFVTLLLLGLLAFNAGLEDVEGKYRPHGEIDSSIFAIILWPVIIAALLVASPFIGLYYGGKFVARKYSKNGK